MRLYQFTFKDFNFVLKLVLLVHIVTYSST